MAVPEPPPPRRGIAVPRATLAALLILVLSAGISFGFVVQRGGIELPVVGAGRSRRPLLSSAAPSPAEPRSGCSDRGDDGVAVARRAPTPIAIAHAIAHRHRHRHRRPPRQPRRLDPFAQRLSRRPKPTKKPTSARYALLKPCADRSGCWIYRVRSGDNLYSIANYFGHSLNTIYAWNPQYPGTALQVGAAIRMPPPTR